MGLREMVEQDVGMILEDEDGFSWPILIKDPGGLVVNMTGFSNDIAQTIDPETGQVFSGRSASVTLRIATLKSKYMDIPRGVSDPGAKPWLVEFKDANGNEYTFKIVQSNPDRTIGVVHCLLEAYE